MMVKRVANARLKSSHGRMAASECLRQFSRGADTENEQTQQGKGNNQAIEIGRADRNLAQIEYVGHQGIQCTKHDYEASAGKEPVVGEYAAFARQQGIRRAARQGSGTENEEQQSGQGNGNQQRQNVDAAGRITRKSVHGSQNAGTHQESANHA